MTDVEVPFPQPMDALLTPPADRSPGSHDIGWLTFIDPKDGHRTSLPVMLDLAHGCDHLAGKPVWHIDIDDDAGTAITSPSVHAVGKWHTPAMCRWRVVDRLTDERARGRSASR
jgi:hypothetical protein